MINYYVEKRGIIEAFDTDLNKLKNSYFGQEVEILETERAIVDFEFADTEEYFAAELEKAKAAKLAEIDAKAYEYEDKGLIAYEGLTPEGETKVVQIETTDKNIGKINGLINMFNANLITEYAWSTKDDTAIVLHSADCYALTGLFAEFSADIWMVKQPRYKAAVDACVSAAQIVAIEVDYTKGIENTESVEDDGI